MSQVHNCLEVLNLVEFLSHSRRTAVFRDERHDACYDQFRDLHLKERTVENDQQTIDHHGLGSGWNGFTRGARASCRRLDSVRDLAGFTREHSS